MDRGSIMTLGAFMQLSAGDLVLASTSSIRAKILHDAGLGYQFAHRQAPRRFRLAISP
jgi:hypothetical protein